MSQETKLFPSGGEASTTEPAAKPPPRFEHINLGEMPPNSHLSGVYSLINPQIGTTRAGKSYLKCLLRDATGEAAARQWTFDEKSMGELVATGFVWISGHSQLYNGQVQIILEQIRPQEVSADEIRALLPTTKRDIDQMVSELTTLLGSLEHPAMKALANAYLADEALMANFKLAPAAMNLHHAWIGGLLEHTLQMMQLANDMLPRYPELNRDLVLMGLFLHDLGKTVELTWERGFNYTTDGNLIGHIVRGAIWLQFKAAMAAKQSGQKLPPDALRVLQHIIVSHHGVPEYGAAKYPSTPEAVFISQLDNLDAKTQIALTAAQRDVQTTEEARGDFTDKIWSLDTRIYWRDPLKNPLPSPDSAPDKTG